MNWRPIRNHYETAYCDMCHNSIPMDADCFYQRDEQTNRGRVICFSCYERYGVNKPVTTTPPPYSPPSVDRNAAIQTAHDENMKSAELNRLALQSLTSAIIDLMRVESDRNELLKKGLEAKA